MSFQFYHLASVRSKPTWFVLPMCHSAAVVTDRWTLRHTPSVTLYNLDMPHIPSTVSSRISNGAPILSPTFGDVLLRQLTGSFGLFLGWFCGRLLWRPALAQNP